MKWKTSVTAGCMLVCSGLGLTLWAADLTLDQIPVAAREALQKLAGNNTITAVESEKEHGIQIYEAEWVRNGVHTEAEVTAEGVLLEMEESVKPDNVPQAVRTAAENALPGAARIHYELHTVSFYEAEAEVDGREKEVSISPAGRVMGGEDDEGDDDDHGDDNDEDEDDDDDDDDDN